MARKGIRHAPRARASVRARRPKARRTFDTALNWAIGILAVLCAYAGYLFFTGTPLPISGWRPATPASAPYVAPITPGVSSRANVVSSEQLTGSSGRRANHAARAPSAASTYSAHFSICHTGGGQNCVVDGDTAWIDGVKTRFADIDAPETHPSHCISEADLGDQATRRMADLMNAGPFQLERIGREEDRWHRKLRIITRDGQSLGGVLVSEGIARWYGRGRRPWC
jgi:endonuclease YncB( thermonuclease family)